MPRLIWVIPWRSGILLVLSWGGSFLLMAVHQVYYSNLYTRWSVKMHWIIPTSRIIDSVLYSLPMNSGSVLFSPLSYRMPTFPMHLVTGLSKLDDFSACVNLVFSQKIAWSTEKSNVRKTIKCLMFIYCSRQIEMMSCQLSFVKMNKIKDWFGCFIVIGSGIGIHLLNGHTVKPGMVRWYGMWYGTKIHYLPNAHTKCIITPYNKLNQ